MKSRSRIALGSILTECNEFGGVPIDIGWFERYELCRGEEVLQVDAGVVGGMMQVMRECGADVVPLDLREHLPRRSPDCRVLHATQDGTSRPLTCISAC